jgi:hypothetical protein
MERLNVTSSAERLSPTTRIALLALAGLLAFCLAGFFIGFGAAAIDHGHLPRKPLAWGILAGAVGLAYGLYRLIRWLTTPSLGAGMTPYNLRYSKMMGIIMLLSAPLGAALAVMALRGDATDMTRRIFVDGALPAAGAIALAALLLVALSIAVILYHRAIDDHEERAYLWGSQIAYYFLAAFIPIYWLLFRGGLVPALTAGGAMLLLLTSFLVQAAVWAWFKFR